MNTPVKGSSKLKAIRWGRVVLISLGAQAVYYFLLWVYAILQWFVPGRTETQMYEFNQQAGATIEAFVGSLVVLTLSYLATRTLDCDFTVNGIMVGVLFSLFNIGLGFVDRVPEQILIRCLLNTASGYLGGAIAQRRYRQQYRTHDQARDA